MDELLTKLKSFNVSAIIADILKDKRLGSIIITTIQERLESEGKDANEKRLKTDIGQSSKGTGIYARKTVKFKKAQGQPTDRVTLKDTGEFYQSFRKQVKQNALGLTADFRNIYDNFQDSFGSEKEFQQAILDLTDSELQRIFDNFIYPQIEQKTFKNIGL